MRSILKISRAWMTLALGVPAATLALASWVGAAPLHRLSSDFQDGESLGQDEVFTLRDTVAGGSHVYTKTLSIPFGVVYVTFSGTGDTHDGAALLMRATVTDAAGNVTVFNPLVGGGLPSAGPPGWITLQKLPVTPGPNNCNDGGGGTADCHDNNLIFSGCALVTSDGGSPPTTHTVDLYLATSVSGSTVFYERASINIDASPNPGGGLCKGVGLPDDYNPAPPA